MNDSAPAAVVGRPYHNLAVSDLRVMLTDEKARQSESRRITGAVQAELQARFGVQINSALHALSKHHGTVNLDVGGAPVKGVVKKEVEWDTDALMAVAATLPWDQVRGMFKITFAVPEKMYEALVVANPELAAKIKDARTTTYKLAVELPEDKA